MTLEEQRAAERRVHGRIVQRATRWRIKELLRVCPQLRETPAGLLVAWAQADAMLETAIKRCGDYPEIIARTRRLAAWVRRQLGITPAMNDRIHQSRAAQPPRRRVPPGILN